MSKIQTILIALFIFNGDALAHGSHVDAAHLAEPFHVATFGLVIVAARLLARLIGHTLRTAKASR